MDYTFINLWIIIKQFSFIPQGRYWDSFLPNGGELGEIKKEI